MIWKVSDFCGVNVITYAIMPNHFHILVRIVRQGKITDRELLRRYHLLHPKPTPYQTYRIEVITAWLKTKSPQGVAWRAQQLALMNDLSAFMRLLKQRFTRWFNATHQRVGTLWAERFKSVLVEYEENTLLTIAAYIDLNAVRKGLVSDPKDYHWCGYAEALAGSQPARCGLLTVCPFPSWSKAAATYRSILYSAGASPRDGKHQINNPSFHQVMTTDGELPLAELLRHRWKHFTDGLALGSPTFIAQHRRRLALPPLSPSLAKPSLPASNQPSLPSTSSPPPSPPPSPTSASWGPWQTLQRIHRRPSDSYPSPP